MKKKVLIIGGGVAGLSAGIYSAMNGYDTEILEMHTLAGGQCTAWDRKHYRFDYCLHWLVGTSHGAFHDVWLETNVLNKDTEILDHEIHSRIIGSDGSEFIIYANIDRWEKYLLEIAPEDEKPIRQMCSDMRKSALLDPFSEPPELRSIFEYIRVLPKMLPIMNIIRKFGRLTCEEYFDKLNFTSKRIKSAIYGMYGNRNFSAMAFIFMLGWFHQKNAGYLIGGSLPLAQRMVEKYESLGGKLSYKKKVAKIIVQNDEAKGVALTDGNVIPADFVISAADGYSTIFKMLEGKYVSKELNYAYKNWELFTPIVQVSFGIDYEVKSEAPITINIEKSGSIGRTRLDTGYTLMNYSFDPTLAPDGKTVMVIRFDSPWNLWEDMSKEEYIQEKKKIETDARKLLESYFPGIGEHIEVVDVATPLTDVHYTGVKDGAYEGFMPSKENMMKSLKMQLPKLKKFYMAGQWLFPGGGLPPSAQSGKWVVQLICKADKREFQSQ